MTWGKSPFVATAAAALLASAPETPTYAQSLARIASLDDIVAAGNYSGVLQLTLIAE
jgi:hypothetical protein